MDSTLSHDHLVRSDLALRRIVRRGELLVEEEEPMIDHGAGPARPRRVVRRGYAK